MSAEAGGGEWGYVGSREGGQPTYRWQEPAASTDAPPPPPPSVPAPEPNMPADADGSDTTGYGAAAVSVPAPSPSRMRLLRRRRCTVVTIGVLGALIVLVLLAFLAFGKDTEPDDNLLLVSVIFRHGDRTPTDTYPKDPHQEHAWPDGFGALTNEGKAQMFALGERLRGRYGRLVGAQYSAGRLRADSSAADRCLMSAGALLAGLMPPEGDQRWHPDLAWQPIPVHYEARLRDTKIAAKKKCPRYDEELQKAYASPEIQALNEENKDMYKYLTTHAGKPISDITAVEFLYTTLLIEKIHKLDLPEWTNSVFPDKMRPLAAKSLAIFTHNDFMKRIRGGPLLKEIVDHMSKKAEDPVKYEGRMYLYSAHDLTIVNVWRTLGFTELLHVGYGASLIFELRWIEQGVNLEVKVLYLNSSSAEPIDLRIPGCSKPCVMDSFVNLVQHFLPTDTDWNKECGLTS